MRARTGSHPMKPGEDAAALAGPRIVSDDPLWMQMIRGVPSMTLWLAMRMMM